MIAIELKRTLKESLAIFLVLLGLLAAMLTTEKDIYLAPVIEIFLLLYASFTGWSLFDRERSEGAMEYLLSLPVSRMRLFFIKFAPRLLCILLMLLFYLIVHSRFEFPSYLSAGDFGIFYIGFFLVSLSLSLSLRNFISAFLLTSVLSGGLAFLNRFFDYTKTDTEVYLQANVPLLVLPVLFVVVFHFFDIKPVASFNLKFGIPAVLYTLLLAVTVYLFLSGNWCQIMLMDDGRVFRSTHHKNQLSNDGVNFTEIGERFDGHQIPVMQQGASLYLERWDNEKPQQILRMDLDTGRYEVLAHLNEDTMVVGAYNRALHRVGVNYYALLVNREKHIYQIMEISPEGTRVIHFPLSALNFNIKKAELVHVSGEAEDRRFFVTVESDLYRIGPMGRVETVASGKHLAAWNDRLMVFTTSGISLFRLTLSGPLELIFKKDGDLRKVRRRFGSVKLRNVLVRGNDQYYLFDQENPALKPVDMPYAPYYYLLRGDRFILVWARADEISVGEITGGKAVILETWETSLKKGRKIVRVFPSGVLVYNNKEHETFLFDRM